MPNRSSITNFPQSLSYGSHRISFESYGDLRGSRFVQAGYINGWWHNDQHLAGAPFTDDELAADRMSSHYVGGGLPEVFEMPLGWAVSRPGDAVLRIGAGLMRRDSDDNDWGQYRDLERPAPCRLLSSSAHAAEFLVEDQATINGQRWAYRLLRQVVLRSDGVSSYNTLQLDVPWSQPLCWFAHPYLMDTRFVRLPLMQAKRLPAMWTRYANQPQASEPDRRGDAHTYQVPATGGFAILPDLSDDRPVIDYHLGHGSIQQRCSQALDKLVVFATSHATSVEPYLSWTGHAASSRRWAVHYRYHTNTD